VDVVILIGELRARLLGSNTHAADHKVNRPVLCDNESGELRAARVSRRFGRSWF
jgi:hypothetical protein